MAFGRRYNVRMSKKSDEPDLAARVAALESLVMELLPVVHGMSPFELTARLRGEGQGAPGKKGNRKALDETAAAKREAILKSALAPHWPPK